MNALVDTSAPRKQVGAAALLAVVFLIIVVLLLGQIVLRTSTTSVNDSLLQHDAVQALFLAESGLERVVGQLSAGTATCGAALVGSWAYAGGNISVPNLGAAFNQGFNGTALPAGQCHVRAVGNSGLFGVQRIIEGIINISGNLLGSANANFNLPPGPCVPPGCQPTGWNFLDEAAAPPTIAKPAWDDTGGPDMSRSAYVQKLSNGPAEFMTAGQFSFTAFTVTAPVTLSLTFDYRVVTNGGSGQEMSLEQVALTSGATVFNAIDPLTGNNYLRSGNTGTFVQGRMDIAITGSGTVPIDGLTFRLFAKAGQSKRIWLDNLSIVGSGGGTAAIQQWREVVN